MDAAHHCSSTPKSLWRQLFVGTCDGKTTRFGRFPRTVGVLFLQGARRASAKHLWSTSFPFVTCQGVCACAWVCQVLFLRTLTPLTNYWLYLWSYKYRRGTQHFTGTVSNEATSEMGYPTWPAGRTCINVQFPKGPMRLLKHSVFADPALHAVDCWAKSRSNCIKGLMAVTLKLPNWLALASMDVSVCVCVCQLLSLRRLQHVQTSGSLVFRRIQRNRRFEDVGVSKSTSHGKWKSLACRKGSWRCIRENGNRTPCPRTCWTVDLLLRCGLFPWCLHGIPLGLHVIFVGSSVLLEIADHMPQGLLAIFQQNDIPRG